MLSRLLFILLLPAVTSSAVSLPETVALASDKRSAALLQKNFIRAETSGSVPVSIHTAVSVMEQPGFLTRVQEEYEKLLPPGRCPEFTVCQSSLNTWFYINKKQERTDITEVARRPGADFFDLVYYTQGRRFFGSYEALIHIRLTGAGDGSTGYTVTVYAYPENGFSRFFARHLQLVEKYFQSKTGEISGIAVQISTRLCGGSPVVPPHLADKGIPIF